MRSVIFCATAVIAASLSASNVSAQQRNMNGPTMEYKGASLGQMNQMAPQRNINGSLAQPGQMDRQRNIKGESLGQPLSLTTKPQTINRAFTNPPPDNSWTTSLASKQQEKQILNNDLRRARGLPVVVGAQRPEALAGGMNNGTPPLVTVIDKPPSTIKQGVKPTGQDVLTAESNKERAAAQAAAQSQQQTNTNNCVVAGVGCTSGAVSGLSW
jgi:hypothetical protein